MKKTLLFFSAIVAGLLMLMLMASFQIEEAPLPDSKYSGPIRPFNPPGCGYYGFGCPG